MIKQFFYILIAFYFCTMPAFGITDYFASTELGSSAESLRIGGIEGMSSFSNSVFENPAALYRVKKISGTIFRSEIMGEVTYLNSTAAYRLPFGVLGVGYYNGAVSGIPYTEEVFYDDESEFEELYTFEHSNSIIKGAIQMSQSKNLHWGFAFSMFNKSLHTVSGSGMNIDGGVIIESDPMVISLSIKNIISAMKVTYNNGGKENLPLQTVGTLGYNLGDLQLFGQFRTINSNRLFLKAGGLKYRPSFLSIIEASIGYREVPALKEGQQRLNGGIGLELSGFQFDYAFETKLSHNDLELNDFNQFHYFSVGCKF